MAPSYAPSRRLRPGTPVLVLAVLATVLPWLPKAAGQGAAGAETRMSYARDRHFFIPFSVDPNDRRIRQVLLYVSEDFGKSYQLAAQVLPTEQKFSFTARGDGWYWFTVQTEEQDGRRTPADLSTAQPALKVCVDTRPPTVTLRAATSRDYPLAFEWEIRDENPDLATLRSAYRPAGVAAAQWVDLPVQQVANGQQAWTPLGNAAQYEVRLQVRDRAGNIGEGLLTLTNGHGGSAAAAGPTADTGVSGVKMVNKKTIRFNVKIDEVGPSKVKTVEVWYTYERRNWQKHEREFPPDTPIEIEVLGEGRYGFTLRAVSGVGYAQPQPQSGDPPQFWVEVDLTPPVVEVKRVEVGNGIDKGQITIEWRASDKFLAAQPITLSYATPEGEWRQFATNIANDGRYIWKMPEGLPYKFPIRVEAIDQAGNVGSAKTAQDVIVDLSIPKARVIGIEGIKGVDPGAAPPPPRPVNP